MEEKMLVVFRNDLLIKSVSTKTACAFGFKTVTCVSDHTGQNFFIGKNMRVFLYIYIYKDYSYKQLGSLAFNQLYLNTTKIDEGTKSRTFKMPASTIF